MNPSRIFARIDHFERQAARNLERPSRPAPGTPRARAEALFASPEARPTLTATPTALATAAQRAKRTQPKTVVPTSRGEAKGAIRFGAKTMKASVVLDAAAVGQIQLPAGAAAPPFVIEVGGRQVHTQVSAKGLRKALATITEHGPDRVAVFVQGKLVGDTLTEAGIVAQPKARSR